MENPNSIDLNISKNITDFIVQSRIEGQFLKINRSYIKKNKDNKLINSIKKSMTKD